MSNNALKHRVRSQTRGAQPWAIALITGSCLSGLLFAATAHATPVSSFQQVHDVVFADTLKDGNNDPVVQKERAVYQAGNLPHYPVTVSEIMASGFNALKPRARETLAVHDDFQPRLKKLVHANGICLAGQWHITQPSAYTCYFKQGATGLFIGRASTSLSETKRGQPRGIAFAGKLFPSTNPQQAVSTANFFVADVLAGTQRDHYLKTGMTNKPRIGFRLAALPVAFKVASAFMGSDSQLNYRPVNNIAMLGEQGAIHAPKYMMIRPAATNPQNNSVDFRDELNLAKQHVPAWDFDILVSDTADKPTDSGWQRVGNIHLDESIVSYGCDRQLHFGHPAVNPKKGDVH